MLNFQFKTLVFSFLMLCFSSFMKAQNPDFIFEPRIEFDAISDDGTISHTILTKAGGKQSSQAPLEVKFFAGITPRSWSVKYLKWTIFQFKNGVLQETIYRDLEDFSLTLSKFGQYNIVLDVVFSKDGEEDLSFSIGSDDVIQIEIGKSALNFPSFFSPNGDGTNDVLLPRPFKSIVKLEGYVVSRWGKVLHTFTLENVQQGWDGRYNGNYVKDGAYLLYINAYGSDGKHYEIKKAINVLKGFRENVDTPTS